VTDTSGETGRAAQRRRTQDRILEAAARRFAEDGYERATIRGIAGDADVDAGLVMHYFGSKQELFRQVTSARPMPSVGEGPEGVAEAILAQLAGSQSSEPVQSLALLRSMLTHPDAAAAAHEGAERYQAEIRRSLTAPDAAVRAALIEALALGVVVSRHLLKSPVLAEASPEELARLLRPCLRSLTGADIDNNSDT
jgi:AcrR family transcriptional regulator